jgi:hypothetical protein
MDRFIGLIAAMLILAVPTRAERPGAGILRRPWGILRLRCADSNHIMAYNARLGT